MIRNENKCCIIFPFGPEYDNISASHTAWTIESPSIGYSLEAMAKQKLPKQKKQHTKHAE